MYESLLTSIENNILTVTVNRPDKLNAINATVMRELGALATQIESDPSVRSVILTGAGGKAFVAGADISQFTGIGSDGESLSVLGQKVFFQFERLSKPVIAAVNGFALGAGCELAMSCHFRIASANARFGQPEVNLGLLPGYGGSQRLVQLVGKGRAMEMLLSASVIDAETALRYGLVNAVVAPDDLLKKAADILNVINSKAPVALAATIRAVNAVFDENADGYALEAKLFGQCFATDDLKEGKAAFLEKRKANFTGK